MTNVETLPASKQDYNYSEQDFDGYSAAPLLIVGGHSKRKIIESQDALAENFVNLAESELSNYVKPALVSFVSRAITSRMHQRESLNGWSYIGRENKKPLYELFPDLSIEQINDACDNSKFGTGTVIQNEIARHAYGMKSVEYANLTIIGEKRKDLEPAMWEDVSGLINADASPRVGQMYGYHVYGFDRDLRTNENIGAMRFGMKRYLGKTEYGAIVKARTTAIVNMSTVTGVDRGLIKLFRETAREGNDIAELPEFRKAVHWLVETELPSGLVLARNETVYGVEN